MAYNKDDKAWFRAHGICTACCKNRAVPYMATCWECQEKDAARRARRTDADRLRDREYRRKLWAERKAAGLCPQCGKSHTGGTLCIRCKVNSRLKNAKAKKPSREDMGVCLWCGAERVEGKKFCAACLERKRQIALYASQRSSLQRQQNRW